jgi:hypothetical protein
VFELIFMQFSDVNETGIGMGGMMGGMNVLRLVCKRLMRVVESCATRLTYQSNNGPDPFPKALRRCTRIKHITCLSHIRSLEGCPTGLKSLNINSASLQSH